MASADRSLIVWADSSRHKIRLVRRDDGTTWILSGKGGKGFQDGRGRVEIQTRWGSVSATTEFAQFNTPFGVSFSPSGDMVAVADSGNHAIRLIHVKDGMTQTLVGGRIGSGYKDSTKEEREASFLQPFCVCFSPNGKYLAVTELGNNRIRLVLPHKRWTCTVAGPIEGKARAFADGGAARARFNHVLHCAFSVDSNTLMVADSENCAIRMISIRDRTTLTLVGSPAMRGFANGIASAARFARPFGVSFLADNPGAFLVVADRDNVALRRVALAGGHVSTLNSQAVLSVAAQSVPAALQGVASEMMMLWLSFLLREYPSPS